MQSLGRWPLRFNFNAPVKSLKRSISVIPANPGSGPGQAPESSYFKYLKIIWTPVSNGVMTFYEIINFGNTRIQGGIS
jgi:hypothetical protein